MIFSLLLVIEWPVSTAVAAVNAGAAAAAAAVAAADGTAAATAATSCAAICYVVASVMRPTDSLMPTCPTRLNDLHASYASLNRSHLPCFTDSHMPCALNDMRSTCFTDACYARPIVSHVQQLLYCHLPYPP